LASGEAAYAEVGKRLPNYRRHKKSGQTIVTLSGHDHYLGPWNSATSKPAYKRLTYEYLAAGGVLVNDRKNEQQVLSRLSGLSPAMRRPERKWRHRAVAPTASVRVVMASTAPAVTVLVVTVAVGHSR